MNSLRNVEYLTIFGQSTCIDISTLVDLKLETLIMNVSNVVHPSSVGALPHLLNLEIELTHENEDNNNELLRAISNLPKLRRLALTLVGVKDIPLGPLKPSLESFSLSHADVKNINFVASFPCVKELSLMNCGSLETISAIGNLTCLKKLKLTNTPLRDVSPLCNLTNIHTLDLSDNINLTDHETIPILAGMTQLEKLNLDGTGITDISRLAHMKAHVIFETDII